MAAVISCQLCELEFPSIRTYISHIRLVHSNEARFTLVCGISGCTTSLGSFGAFNSHVYRHHRNELDLKEKSINSALPLQDNWQENIDPIPVTENECTELHVENNQCSSCLLVTSESVQQQSAKFILRLSQQHHLSQRAISDIIQKFQEHSEFVAASVSSVIAHKMISQGIVAPGTVPQICHVNDDDIPNIFAGLETSYLQENYYMKNFKFVVSQIMHIYKVIIKS